MCRIIPLLVFVIFTSCNQAEEQASSPTLDWSNREVSVNSLDSLMPHSSYLSVYSQIYSYSPETTFPLTATVSIHNTSLSDSIFITKADYYNTHGELIRNYINKPIFVKPLESLQIVINETDGSGGTGANFVFDWLTQNEGNEPFFEAVMISTSGQQGMSFTTKGVRTK
ncbi:Protein of unknown function (DUF3124) [Owenweeksia hongkongensis DSM 17368]|uniref:DUF3124 domain-containing protein n=1 Tax=Owenweeksia hongkongensis (strain DSM 17368 / CIP 108786 / JCM 12287 / NRRL B-23963 / UST20020801) TaxID=926562 RepID=G8R802_OWEHD|nr:DUF3124 domain-containing protein [Owenweeksia hongkongensis]AEV31325.1 Protein of unknown function (DUF3124) [Owenweeksia hongkongensis DSM 17368]